METPQPIRLLLLANYPYLRADDPELQASCSRADVVVSLGGVDLHELAKALPPKKPALCVFGPKDDYINRPPEFHVLHRNGFNFRGWDLAGLSGAPRFAPGPGFYLTDDESRALLQDFPQANIFFSHAFPQHLTQSETNPQFGMAALDEYLQAKPPIYHFYAHPELTAMEEYGPTLSVGVHGIFEPPVPLEFV